MKSLVIVESPGKVGKIQSFLGKDYVVKSSFGHIRDLNEKSLSIDIDNDFEPQYEISPDKRKVIGDLKKAASAADMVYLASDEDREGEAISWHLYQCLDLKPETTKRIVFHEITPTALRDAVQNPRQIDMNMVNAQQARRVLDRLVGFELSPVLWKKVQPKLSAGRVQSVALRLVVDREREIESHVATPYYKIDGKFAIKGASGTLAALCDSKPKDIAAARALLESLNGANFTIASIETKEASRYPAPPFETSTLQQEAAQKLRFSVTKTMSVAQSLYEKGHITYMRTDSTNLSNLALGAAKSYILGTYGEDYYHFHQYRTTAKDAQEAHEAIRPTYLSNPTIEGTRDEQRLYDLIFKRTIASQMADAKLLKTDITIANDRCAELFLSKGSKVLFDGFLKVYSEDRDDAAADEDVILPDITIGQSVDCKQITAETKYTQAPPRYSEGTLVKKLKELGIGRPSTYSTIISTLTKARGYIQKGNVEGVTHEVENLILKGGTITSKIKKEVVGAEKDRLIPQNIGCVVSDFLVRNFESILDYGFTANVEENFDRVADGEIQWKQVIRDFYSPFHEMVTVTTAEEKKENTAQELGQDPVSGETIYLKYGKYGPYLQKGPGENKCFAKIEPNTVLSSITLQSALAYFSFPRILGVVDGQEVTVAKGRYGAYIKKGTQNVTIPRNVDPVTITLDQALQLLESKPHGVIAEWTEEGIKVQNGIYGPYISCNGKNYHIPPRTKAENLTLEDCKKIIEQGAQTNRKR